MGWLFSSNWTRKADMRRHLCEENGLKTLKSCWTGNNLWAVQECTKGEYAGQRFIALYLCKFYKDEGGYKDVDESAGPYYFNCPLAYLDMVPDPGGYATEWRANVRKYWADRNRKLVEGQRIKLYGKEYTVGVVRNGKQRVWDYDVEYTLPKRMMKDVEILGEN